MWNSRDLALVILLAGISFVYTVFIGQLGALFTGILGFNYFFIIGHALFISLGFLLYEGRRWRFFLQGLIVAILSLPTYQMGIPYDVIARAPTIIGSFVVDLIFNSVYDRFYERKKKMWFSIIVGISFMIITPFFAALTRFFFYTPEAFTGYVTVLFLFFPVLIGETIVGSYLAFKLYQRIKKTME